MKKAEWKKNIRKACEDAGTYQPFFDQAIDALAGILELRDAAQKQYDDNGGETTVTHTNKGGNTNVVKNPALVILMDCNAQALAYWKELGLTSRSYKSMNGTLNVRVEGRTLEDALAELGA